MICKRGRRDTF